MAESESIHDPNPYRQQLINLNSGLYLLVWLITFILSLHLRHSDRGLKDQISGIIGIIVATLLIWPLYQLTKKWLVNHLHHQLNTMTIVEYRNWLNLSHNQKQPVINLIVSEPHAILELKLKQHQPNLAQLDHILQPTLTNLSRVLSQNHYQINTIQIRVDHQILQTIPN